MGESYNSRQLALLTLQSVQRGAFADIALDKSLHQTEVSDADRRLVTELVYGCVRRARTLDALIDQFAKKKAQQQPPNLRLILHLGLYQLRYLNQIPAAAAVDTTVDLAKQNGFSGLSGFVNGLLRQYLRQSEQADPLQLPDHPLQQIAVQYSYPDWIVQVWADQFGLAAAEQLCEALNHPPHIDLRVNLHAASVEQVVTAMEAAGVEVDPILHLPAGLRLRSPAGAIQKLPGFADGWWTVQDASAQLVTELLDPQPGEKIIDACAAPGGKTTHIAEKMGDRGNVWGCDRSPNRLKKLQENATRLKLHIIQTCAGDSRSFPQFTQQADRVLLDAPCSGLGTLNRHADARWRQTPDSVGELVQLQTELLQSAATWVKPDGVLVYATCTLHPAENEQILSAFLKTTTDWQLEAPDPHNPAAAFVNSEGWIKVLPYQHQMDGFFMARLRHLKPPA